MRSKVKSKALIRSAMGGLCLALGFALGFGLVVLGVPALISILR